MPPHGIEARVQKLVDLLVAKKQVRNAVVGLRSADRRIDAGASAGHSDPGGMVAMTLDTPYYLASITKMYTATVIMKLAGSGAIDLYAPVASYLDRRLVEGIHVIDGVDHSDQISVVHLLKQTSGLADYFEGKPKAGASLVHDLKHGRDRAVSLSDILEIVRSLPPEFAPGTGRKAHYSDTNYALLGAIIETVTGTSIADNFQDLILAPLGLYNTYVFDHDRAQPPPAAAYFKDKPLNIPLAMSSFASDGGVVSTLAESLQFLGAVFGGELLTEDQLTYMTSEWNRIFFPLQYGCGLMRFEVPRWMSPLKAPPELIGHSGSTGSFAFYNPKRDAYLAGTVNQMDKRGLPFRLMTRLIGFLD